MGASGTWMPKDATDGRSRPCRKGRLQPSGFRPQAPRIAAARELLEPLSEIEVGGAVVAADDLQLDRDAASFSRRGERVDEQLAADSLSAATGRHVQLFQPRLAAGALEGPFPGEDGDADRLWIE